jgi:lipopolysaccharide transport system ATP-binding protein
MTDLVLTAKDLSKSYPTFSNNLVRFASWFNLPLKPIKEFWAVKDISLELRRGEAMALIGKNGAGKSTLLKLIAGTVNPTSGSIGVKGTISSILELGLGFNPELTGRENVFLAGGLMGLGSAQISHAVKDIENFSELGMFFEQPLRVYSSGMTARLAFSLATCTTPDILIVDEVLSVGDSAFQRKCFRKIESFLENGTSLLFVSHDLESVKRLCTSALYLKDGKTKYFGDSRIACDIYERESYSEVNSIALVSNGLHSKLNADDQLDTLIPSVTSIEYGNGGASIVDCWVENSIGERVNVVRNGEQFYWCYTVKFSLAASNPHFGMRLKSIDGIDVFSTNSKMLSHGKREFNAGDNVFIKFQLAANLAPAVYFLNAGVSITDHAEEDRFLCRKIDAMGLRVTSANSSTLFGGIADLAPSLIIDFKQA